MPFPIAAAGAGIGILGNIAAYIAAQNAKRKRYPYAEMLQAARNEGLQGANAATANYGLQAGPRYSMQGLQRSGIPGSEMARVSGQNAQAGLSGLGRLRAQLMGQEAEDDNAYNDQRAANLSRLLQGIGGSVGQGVAQYAGMEEEGRQMASLEALLRQYYGGEDEATDPITQLQFRRRPFRLPQLQQFNPYGGM